MVDRGNCHFVKKVQNIQKFGGLMAIIIDRNDEEHTHMSDDGQGSSIYIPSFLIGKRDGDLIKEAIHEAKVDDIGKKKDDWDNGNSEDEDARKNRDWANKDEADRDQYQKTGHQVIMQGIIAGKVSKSDTVNIDLWYNSAYELYNSNWNLQLLAEMSDAFHQNVSVVIQPRTLFTDGRQFES